MFLNLDTLAEYQGDHFNFVAAVGCNINNQSINLIDISEQPIKIINGISYFLLAAKSCQPELIKLLYMFSQSFYIAGSQVRELENILEKGVCIEGAWDVKNFLYVVSQSSFGNLS